MSDTKEVTNNSTANTTVLILSFTLVFLVILLIFLYKKLNRDTDGKYTVRRMVYKEGGLRDRARGAVGAIEARLGTRLWPCNDSEESVHSDDEEGNVESGGSGNEGERGEGEEDEDEEGIEDESGDSHSCDRSERESLVVEAVGGTEEGKKEKEEKEEEENSQSSEDEDQACDQKGLLVDLNKQFSGSAIWSEDEAKKGERQDNHVTVL